MGATQKIFTVIYDEGMPEYVTANSLGEIYKRLDMNPDREYLSVIEGKHKIPPGALNKIRKDPVAFEMKFNAFNESKKSGEVQPPAPSSKTEIIPPPVISAVVEPRPSFVVSEPKYFEEDGIKFKLENDVLYKQTWVDTEDARIISIKTGKPYIGDKYKIQTKQWKRINGQA